MEEERIKYENQLPSITIAGLKYVWRSNAEAIGCQEIRYGVLSVTRVTNLPNSSHIAHLFKDAVIGPPHNTCKVDRANDGLIGIYVP
jgi:hypothetical protein